MRDDALNDKRLEWLLNMGLVWREKRDYVGCAIDGVVVSLGEDPREYLKDYPGPEDW